MVQGTHSLSVLRVDSATMWPFTKQNSLQISELWNWGAKLLFSLIPWSRALLYPKKPGTVSVIYMLILSYWNANIFSSSFIMAMKGNQDSLNLVVVICVWWWWIHYLQCAAKFFSHKFPSFLNTQCNMVPFQSDPAEIQCWVAYRWCYSNMMTSAGLNSAVMTYYKL